MPDESIRTWNVRIPDAAVKNFSSVGVWTLQDDGSVVGIAPTRGGTRFLVVLHPDGSSSGRVLSEQSEVYATLHDDAGTTLLTYRGGAVHFDTYRD